MKKFLLFLATEKGYISLKKLVENKKRYSIGCVVTFPEIDVVKDWSNDIEHLCRENNIRFFRWKDVKSNLFEVIQKNHITSAAAISWKYYISLEINHYLEDELIVFHDSLLPKYRGFAPTPTAIINGEKEVGITALFASEQIDCGDIILQKKIAVGADKYIVDIIKEEAVVYAEMLIEIMERIQIGNLIGIPQDESKATYSLWRNIEDCHINWNGDAREIYNFIRALGFPYLGAYTYAEGRKIIIDRSNIVDYELNFEKRDSGKIWKISNNNAIVVCGSGLLRIERAHYEDGEVAAFRKLRVRLG